MKRWIALLIILQLFLVSCSPNKYDSDDFIDNYSERFPIIEDVISKFANEDFDIIELNTEDSNILFCFTSESSYEEIDEIILLLSEDFLMTYNTSLSGRGGMDDDGRFTYNTYILENSNFALEITNIKNRKNFLKDSKDIDGIRQIGDNNIIVKLNNK